MLRKMSTVKSVLVIKNLKKPLCRLLLKKLNKMLPVKVYSDAQMKQRGVENIPLCFLAKSLENMSLCHAAFFCEGWENARGCKIEHEAAVAYGLDIIYENEEA